MGRSAGRTRPARPSARHATAPAKRRARTAAPEQSFDAVHAPLLRGFDELVAELGGDGGALLRGTGITAATPAAGYRQTIALIERAATALDCPDFGLRLAAQQRGGMRGPLGAAMSNARTFGDALDYVSRHSYAHSLAARVWLRPAGHGGVFAGHDVLLDGVPHRSQAMEHLILSGHLLALELSGGRARARRVHFRHLPLSPRRVYRRHFGCEVRFGQSEDGIAFGASDLAAPIVAADADSYAEITTFIEQAFARQQPPLHAQARGLIIRLLAGEDCSNARIAAELKLHPRTLHRRLTAEGTSFQRVKDEVRRDALLYYAQRTPLGFAQIAEKLGLAEQAVLARYCQRWFGRTPTQVRALPAAMPPLSVR